MSDANVRRLVATLGRMRGAALKLGQFMSIQGKLYYYIWRVKPQTLAKSSLDVTLLASQDSGGAAV